MSSRLKNRVRLARSYCGGKLLGELYPQQAVIELTNRCNLACVMCPHKKMTRTQGIMDYNLFKRAVDEFKEFGELVYLYGVGESLLMDNFFDYAEYAVAGGLSTCLATNATMITPRIAERLISSGIEFIILAIDGASPEVYNQVRRGANLEATINKCKSLLAEKIGQSASTHITVQLISMEANSHEFGQLRGLFSPRERRAVNQFRIKPLFDSFAESVEHVEHTRACYFLWNFVNITWDGGVSVCCMDYDGSEIVGDLKVESLSEIWNGPAINRLRQLHLDLEFPGLPLCRGCTLPENSYFRKPNIMGSSLLNSRSIRRLTPIYEKLQRLKTNW